MKKKSYEICYIRPIVVFLLINNGKKKKYTLVFHNINIDST